MIKSRYRRLDAIRGIALINMAVFHAIWDLVYIYHFQWNWYKSEAAYIWQQGICWTFISLSGFCCLLGSHPIKRGLTISLDGAVITAVTLAFMPQNRVVFGVLTLIGSCMMIVGAFGRYFKIIPPMAGFLISSALFAVTRNINRGWLGFEGKNLFRLPDALYADIATAYLGFPDESFYSTDYFSLFPWLFLFMAGCFLFLFLEKKHALGVLEKGVFSPIEWLGRHSLGIYMIHQPVIYLVLGIVFYKK